MTHDETTKTGCPLKSTKNRDYQATRGSFSSCWESFFSLAMVFLSSFTEKSIIFTFIMEKYTSFEFLQNFLYQNGGSLENLEDWDTGRQTAKTTEYG